MLNHAIAKNNKYSFSLLIQYTWVAVFTSLSCFSLPFVLLFAWGFLTTDLGCKIFSLVVAVSWKDLCLLGNVNVRLVASIIRYYAIVKLAACFRLGTVPIYKYFSLQLTVLFFSVKSVCFDNRIVGWRIFTVGWRIILSNVEGWRLET